jgi:hypothetical protein
MICPVCFKGFQQTKGGRGKEQGGRPALYCSTRCRQAAWRARERLRDQAAKAQVHYSPPPRKPAPVDVSAYAPAEVSAPVACHICQERDATVGPPGSPLLCEACARA